MIEFLQKNAGWLIPVVAAIISGIFSLFNKSRNHKQKIGDITHSDVTIINGDNIVNDDKK